MQSGSTEISFILREDVSDSEFEDKHDASSESMENFLQKFEKFNGAESTRSASELTLTNSVQMALPMKSCSETNDNMFQVDHHDILLAEMIRLFSQMCVMIKVFASLPSYRQPKASDCSVIAPRNKPFFEDTVSACFTDLEFPHSSIDFASTSVLQSRPKANDCNVIALRNKPYFEDTLSVSFTDLEFPQSGNRKLIC